MKRMTAEVIDRFVPTTQGYGNFPLLNPEARAYITIRDPINRKKRKFGYMSKHPHKILGSLHNGDIIEFDYTEPSSWLSSLFSYPEICNVVAKVKDTRLEELLAKTPKIGTSVGVTMVDRFKHSPHSVVEKGELKLYGSLKDIVKFVYYNIQNVEGFVYIDFHPERNSYNVKYETHFQFEHDIFFQCNFHYGGDNYNGSRVGIIIEPVDNMHMIVHAACSSTTDSPSISPQTLISRIIAKLSQANRQ